MTTASASVRQSVAFCVFVLVVSATSTTTIAAQSGDSAVQVARLIADPADRGRDFFGRAVAIDGDTAIIGEYNDSLSDTAQESATVFIRESGRWSRQQRLIASDGDAIDGFGSSVCLDGNVAVVGAPSDESGDNDRQGSAYVFERVGTTWTELARLAGSLTAFDSQFGTSCVVRGSMIVVGAPGDPVDTNDFQGAAYVFVRNGAGWEERQRLSAKNGESRSAFGRDIALSGDILVVGANGTVGGSIDRGSAVIYARISDDNWIEQAMLLAPDGAPGDRFGWSVGVLGGTIMIGAPSNDLMAVDGLGSAYVFTNSGSGWLLEQQLWPPSLGVDPFGGEFGSAVALNEVTAVICASVQRFVQGFCYTFVRTPSGLLTGRLIAAANGVSGEAFGADAAISGGALLVGAPGDDGEPDDGINDSGAAYVFAVAPELVFASGIEAEAPPLTPQGAQSR